MSLQAHEVSMTLSVTGEARRPSPKSPWSGWLGRGFLRRLSWTSLLLNMLLEFLATIWKSKQIIKTICTHVFHAINSIACVCYGH